MVAAMRLIATVTALAFMALAEPAAAAWRPPVAGTVTRAFDLGADPFEAGRHRGVDLAAPPGTTVRAPCTGPVAFAGRAGTNGRVVTLLCGPWRVTHMPLASIVAREGTIVRTGEPLGTVAASGAHEGLHLGVRREGTRFGYADPQRFLATTHAPPAPPLSRAPRRSRPRPTTRPPAPRPLVTPRPVAAAAPRDSTSRVRAPFAPWPAWLGLALVLAGAGLRVGVRLRTTRGRVRTSPA
jgi:hypothetical protein